MAKRLVVIGSTGAIGRALVEQLQGRYRDSVIYSFSRQISGPEGGTIQHKQVDYHCETSLSVAADFAGADGPIDMVLVATGLLHEGAVQPEKSLRDLSRDAFLALYEANAILPAMAAKYFVPKLNRAQPAYFAALSARVGSISDNRLGGWYAYRASKAALNMIIKNTAIETARRNRSAILVGLHPGTVDSGLSAPFQGAVPEGKLFPPSYAASCLLDVLDGLTPEDSGKCFAWDGVEITP